MRWMSSASHDALSIECVLMAVRDREGPPVTRRARCDLAQAVNAMLGAYPQHAVASYSHQLGSVLQAFPLYPGLRGTTASYPHHFKIIRKYATQ